MADYRIEQQIDEQSYKLNCFEPIHLHYYILNVSEERVELVKNPAIRKKE